MFQNCRNNLAYALIKSKYRKEQPNTKENSYTEKVIETGWEEKF